MVGDSFDREERHRPGVTTNVLCRRQFLFGGAKVTDMWKIVGISAEPSSQGGLGPSGPYL